MNEVYFLMSENHKNKVNDILSHALSHGIEIEPGSVQINESGLDFFAVFANDKEGATWVLRTPRRPDVVASAAYEKKVLDVILSRLPVAVPHWQIHTPELIAYRILQGNPAATINPEKQQYDWFLNQEALPDLFVQSLAETLVALHNIDHGTAADAGVRVKQSAEVRRTLSVRMENIKGEFGVARELWDRWQKWLSDDTCWPEHSALVHGDLHPGHIMVNDDGKVTGLLDWTEGEVADPAIDFTVHYRLFGEPGLKDLLSRYEAAGGKVWPRITEHIREWIAAYPILIAEFALKSGIEEYMEMARATLGVDEAVEARSAEQDIE
jgi:macrolide phosphotransferase